VFGSDYFKEQVESKLNRLTGLEEVATNSSARDKMGADIQSIQRLSKNGFFERKKGVQSLTDFYVFQLAGTMYFMQHKHSEVK